MTTVTVHHPDVASLSAAAELYAAVTGGKWGTVARVCADHLGDVAGAGAALEELAHRTAWSFPQTSVEAVVKEDAGTWTVPQAFALPVLDLYSRVLTGQWREVALVAAFACPGPAYPYAELASGLPLVDELERVRVRWQRPGGLWPEHPRASVGIAQGPEPARLAYHAFKLLGGGTPGAPTFSLDTPVRVTVGEDDALLPSR